MKVLLLAALTPVLASSDVTRLTDGRGYSSWPMIQSVGNRLVCIYSRGTKHSIEEGVRGASARTSDDGGATWSAETLLANDPVDCEVPIGKGLDGDGAALFWVRCYSPKAKRHDLYRTTDGVKFERIASPKLDPLPMQITDVFKVPGGLMCLWFAGDYSKNPVNSWGTLKSGDNGRTWTQRTVERGLVREDWPTEPSAVCLGDGRILVVARTEWTDGKKGQFQIVSRDWGRTWTRSRTNILDVKASTPSLILDAKTGTVHNYYYDRLNGLLKRRVAHVEDVFDRPTAWPESEVLVRGSDAPWESGNANATVLGGDHFVAYYSGRFPDTDVYVRRVRQTLTPVEFHAGELGGEIDRRIWNVATNHFLKLDIDGRFVEKFAQRAPNPREGRYEGVGKLLDAAVKLSAYTGDAQVRVRTRELFEKLAATQDEDGYIGFWQRTANEGQFYANWTCHEMEYLLIAFCDYARTFGDAKARAAAVRLGEYLYRVFPRDARSAKLMIVGYAEAFIDLYRLTGERKYLDYAATIPYTGPSFGVNQPLRGWTQDFGPWNGNHSYTCLARAFAASEIALETGETDILKTPQVLKELLSEPGKGPLFLTGGCSVGEHLQRNQNGCDQCQETCASAYFILFLDSCLRRDGDFANADLIERVVWNALFGANSPDGRRIRYHTALCGARVWDEHDDGYCCCGNFRRAIGDLPARLCYKLPDGSLAIALYAPFKKTFDLGGKAFGLRCETKYPADGTVDYVFEDDVELTLAFRVPAWCEGMTAEVNGEGAKPVVRGANALASVARRWTRGDRLRLRMPMPWRFAKGTAFQSGRIAVERGPLVYCLGTARNPELAQTKHSFRGLTLDPASVSAPYPDATVRPGGTAAKARVRLPEEGWREAVLTEFADPSGRETYFYTPREKSGAKLVVTPGTNGCCVAGKPGANLVFIRGRGEPGRTLHAVFGPYTQDVKADEKGDWTACMDIRRHGKGPFDLTVTDGESELVFRKQEVR